MDFTGNQILTTDILEFLSKFKRIKINNEEKTLDEAKINLKFEQDLHISGKFRVNFATGNNCMYINYKRGKTVFGDLLD